MAYEAIKQYKAHSFSSGVVNGEDFLKFHKSFNAATKKAFGEEFELFLPKKPNHYCWSGFVKNKSTGKFAYISISDVRNGTWYDKILVRTAKSEKDFTGGFNNFTKVPNIKELVLKLTA